jgi:hypothetical protein
MVSSPVSTASVKVPPTSIPTQYRARGASGFVAPFFERARVPVAVPAVLGMPVPPSGGVGATKPQLHRPPPARGGATPAPVALSG